MQIYW